MTHDTLGPTSLGAGSALHPLELLASYRGIVVGIYAVVAGAAVAATGIPDRPTVLWLLIVLIALVCAGSERGVRRFLMDWLPLLVIAAGYDTVRAQAPALLGRAAVRPQLRFDEIVFGGTAPTVTLQRWLGAHTGHVHWWDFIVWLGYLSHFVVSLVVATYLYRVDRARFRRFAALIVTVSVAGFITYFIIPAVPPWLASRQGALPHTTRVVHDVWSNLGLPGVAKIFNGSAQLANPVAALPSLHAAWPMMLLLFLWPTARRGRWVLVGYLVFMTFVLVYGAEHYVSDILLGWVYATIVYSGYRWYGRRGETTEARR